MKISSYSLWVEIYPTSSRIFHTLYGVADLGKAKEAEGRKLKMKKRPILYKSEPLSSGGGMPGNGGDNTELYRPDHTIIGAPDWGKG